MFVEKASQLLPITLVWRCFQKPFGSRGFFELGFLGSRWSGGGHFDGAPFQFFGGTLVHLSGLCQLLFLTFSSKEKQQLCLLNRKIGMFKTRLDKVDGLM